MDLLIHILFNIYNIYVTNSYWRR